MNELLKEAAEWSLMGLLLQCPSEQWLETIVERGTEMRDQQLRNCVKAAIQQANEGLYHSIFGPGGPAPAREVSCHETMQLGYLLSELSAYYDAFAFDPGNDEPADHISVELRFMSYLRLKQVYALASGDQERAAITAQAADNFRNEHLRMMAEPLATALANSEIPYLAGVSAAMLERTGPRPQDYFPLMQESIAADQEDASLFDCA